MPDSEAGKPPKSVAQIRDALESIHRGANVETHHGPHAGGFERDYPITVATYYDPVVAREVQNLLSQHGVFSKLIKLDNGASIVVDNEDQREATQLLQQHRSEFPNRLPQRESQRFDYLIFGIAIGLTMGMILFAGVWDKPMAISIPVTFTAIGVTFGHLIDRVRMANIRSGEFRLGVWELLVAAAIPGLAILAFRVIEGVFRG